MKNTLNQYELDIIQLRNKINNIDNKIVNLIAKRMSIVKTIGEIKNNHNISIIDTNRELHLQSLHNELAIKYNLDPIFISNLFNKIIKYARKVQKD